MEAAEELTNIRLSLFGWIWRRCHVWSNSSYLHLHLAFGTCRDSFVSWAFDVLRLTKTRECSLESPQGLKSPIPFVSRWLTRLSASPGELTFLDSTCHFNQRLPLFFPYNQMEPGKGLSGTIISFDISRKNSQRPVFLRPNLVWQVSLPCPPPSLKALNKPHISIPEAGDSDCIRKKARWKRLIWHSDMRILPFCSSSVLEISKSQLICFDNSRLRN